MLSYPYCCYDSVLQLREMEAFKLGWGYAS